MVEPIRPDEIVQLKRNLIPDFVYIAFNRMIAKKFNGSYASFTQEEIIKEILSLNTEYDRTHIFEEKWLDVENIYREYGWWVEYDKPAFNETYDATFTFTQKSK